MPNQETNKTVYNSITQGDGSEAYDILCNDKEYLQVETPFGSWLHIAAREGNFSLLKQLIDLGIDIHRKDKIAKGTPLNQAAGQGHIEIVEYLLNLGAELDVACPEGNPLFSAIHGRHYDMAKLLIDRGIDISIEYGRDCGGKKDAISFAQEWGAKDILRLLKEKQK